MIYRTVGGYSKREYMFVGGVVGNVYLSGI